MKLMMIPAVLVLSTLALAGCAAPQVGTPAPVEGVAGTSGDSPSQMLTRQDSVEKSAQKPSDSGQLATDTGRQVISTGYVTITVEKPAETASKAIQITEKSGGRIDGRTESAAINGNGGSATLILRIPADTLTTTLDKLRELGEVQEVSLNATDVTRETQDLDARITALTASVDRLLALLSTATTTENLITLETAISTRQGELESLQSQRRYYADQVDLSTVTLNLVSDYTAPAAAPDNFFSGLAAGWNSFVGFFAALLVALGVLLPWLAVVGIIACVIVVLVKRRRRAKAASRDHDTAVTTAVG
ncbi:MAG: DUF4349 domain-containing protein [Rhodoglobus sp.]